MMSGLKAGYEKLLVVSFALLFATGCLWWWWQQGEVRQLRALPVAVGLSGVRHEPVPLPAPAPRNIPWPRAAAQSHGPGWLYELFTPPVIYYHPLARSFAVTPPTAPAGAGAGFGLELLAVRAELFRLQLEGYFGAPGGYLAAFTSPQSPETLLAREGRRFDDLGLTLKSFVVEKVPVVHNDAWPVYEVAALAVLADERNGGEVVLDSRARKFTGAPLALLQTAGGGRPRELREGETFGEADFTYLVERIQLDPPEVVVARSVPGLPQPERRVLRPVAKPSGLAGTPNPGQPFPGRSDRPLAVSDR